MAIEGQFLGPKGFERHLVTRAQARGRTKRTIFAALMLTPMVDMFSLLVIFLLQSFSASPEVPFANQGIMLPAAANAGSNVDAPVLSLGDQGVFLDSKLVGTISQVLDNPTTFLKRLSDLRLTWQKSHANQEFPGEINIQAHKEIPSTTVSEFMALLGREAYGSFQLAVVGGAR
ncbi:MAG: biopolymer transporter ExbD [Bdellovibrionales bacterium]|nr:biopolymer transporter ExbD [Bdellovibrionales bacterium]